LLLESLEKAHIVNKLEDIESGGGAVKEEGHLADIDISCVR